MFVLVVEAVDEVLVPVAISKSAYIVSREEQTRGFIGTYQVVHCQVRLRCHVSDVGLDGFYAQSKLRQLC